MSLSEDITGINNINNNNIHLSTHKIKDNRINKYMEIMESEAHRGQFN